jgi:rubredoxin
MRRLKWRKFVMAGWILQCCACAHEHDELIPPKRCPKCGGSSFERIELFAEDRAAAELAEKIKAHHDADPGPRGSLRSLRKQVA